MSPLQGRSRSWARSADPLEVVAVLAAVVALTSYGVVTMTRDAAPTEQYVVVVTLEGSADRLVAGSLGDQILTVPSKGSSESIVAEVQRLDPTRVLILGGRDVVSADAAARLAAATTASVTRLAGADRYETAAQAAVATFEAPVRQVVIATIEASQNAAEVIGPPVRRNPVLLVTRDRVPPATTRALQRLQPRTLTVIGGADAVSDTVMRQLRKHTAGQVTSVAAQ